MRAAQAAASSGVAMGFAGGAGFAAGAANFVDASGASVTVVAGFAAVLERRDHENCDKNNQEHDAVQRAVGRRRAGHAAARGARQGLAASRRPGH